MLAQNRRLQRMVTFVAVNLVSANQENKQNFDFRFHRVGVQLLPVLAGLLSLF
uniref:Uncharacterized protein n=1 Tax=Magallana gigas TaxID=29159 RepID=K1S233_MAGGI